MKSVEMNGSPRSWGSVAREDCPRWSEWATRPTETEDRRRPKRLLQSTDTLYGRGKRANEQMSLTLNSSHCKELSRWKLQLQLSSCNCNCKSTCEMNWPSFAAWKLSRWLMRATWASNRGLDIRLLSKFIRSTVWRKIDSNCPSDPSNMAPEEKSATHKFTREDKGRQGEWTTTQVLLYPHNLTSNTEQTYFNDFYLTL